jgi:hypothetical protein
MAALAEDEIFFCIRSMYGTVLERKPVRSAPWSMSTCMALSQPGLVEAIDFGDTTLQVDTVAFAALTRGLMVGDAVAGQPAGGMFAAAPQGRGLIVGFAAAKEGTAGGGHAE